MHKVLVTGSNGQLGCELKDISSSYPQLNLTFVDRSHFDLSNIDTIDNFFSTNHFDFIINCAAYTAVDRAEKEKELANTINHLAVKKLAEVAKNKNIGLIHLSTDYVFDGLHFRAYNETDKTNPISIYGKTKLAGEKAILNTAPLNTVILRTSWLYSSYGNNFVKTMIRLGEERGNLGVIFDQIGTPTYAKDLARTILDILPHVKNSNPEIYHYSNEGAASWYDFAKAIFEISGISCNVKALTTEEYPTIAARPFNSHLNKKKIKSQFTLEIPYWRDSLTECLKKLK